MEIGESFIWKNHGKLAHLQILAHKIFHGPEMIFVINYDPRLRHVFDDASVDTEKKKDGQ